VLVITALILRLVKDRLQERGKLEREGKSTKKNKADFSSSTSPSRAKGGKQDDGTQDFLRRGERTSQGGSRPRKREKELSTKKKGNKEIERGCDVRPL